MHRFRLEHRVSHADVDMLGELKTSALLGILEQAAVEASTDAGLDPAWYTNANRFWLIRRTQVERFLPVGGGDLIAVDTRVADWRRARSLRHYEVRLAAPGRGVRDPEATARARGDEESALVARATTDWVYCDIESGRPVSIPDDVRRAFSGDGLGETLPRTRALADAGDGSDAVDMRLVPRPSQLDHVTHVNNAAYAAFLEDGAFELFAARGFPLPVMLEQGGALRCRALDVEYLVDALAGDELLVRSHLAAGDFATVPIAAPTAEAELVQTIERPDGTRLVRSASTWIWRRRPAILGGVPPPPGLTNDERSCLRRFVALVVDALGDDLDAIWLFGSAARAERWPSGMPIRSDIDLLIATSESVAPEQAQAISDATYPLFLESGRQISPQFRTSTELESPRDERAAAFLESFRREAALLWRRPPSPTR